MSDEQQTPSVYETRELVTVKEFADLARQHPLSVYRRVREQRQPGVVRIGRAIRINVRLAIRPV